ncbi:MAG TPA: ImmA/IrrE family metallo-endopeptidase [Actinomycetaceae bacterium]|nr:ImmA/IrrE family metallo-endopeptidase [Actinomycetaceae bacterium]
MWHPWRRLRALTHVTLHWQPLQGLLGATNGSNLIVMDPRQSQAQRRCTIAHELAHIELGHTGGCTGAEEAQARRLAARWLIDMDRLLDALAWSEELEEVAEELWVDLDTLYARLDGLTAQERARVVALAGRVERGA